MSDCDGGSGERLRDALIESVGWLDTVSDAELEEDGVSDRDKLDAGETLLVDVGEPDLLALPTSGEMLFEYVDNVKEGVTRSGTVVDSVGVTLAVACCESELLLDPLFWLESEFVTLPVAEIDLDGESTREGVDDKSGESEADSDIDLLSDS